jgi:hypothetical protein
MPIFTVLEVIDNFANPHKESTHLCDTQAIAVQAHLYHTQQPEGRGIQIYYSDITPCKNPECIKLIAKMTRQLGGSQSLYV